jgi:cytosine/adenosine deaminase-related metal-dependent hydrolase/ribose/xylose/arabinose/galactoside ABC-type transport system permease subunit
VIGQARKVLHNLRSWLQIPFDAIIRDARTRREIVKALRKLWERRAWKPIVLLAFFIFIVGSHTANRSSAFLSEFNLNSLLLATLPLALVAMAQVNALLVGYLDISVGSVMSLCVVVASYIIVPNASGEMIGIGVLAMLLTGLVVGLTNAGLVHGVKMPSIIATLATLSIVDGIALMLRPTASGLINFDAVSRLTTSVGFVPVAFIVLVVLAVTWDIWLHWTTPGLLLRAVGNDLTSARRLGAATTRIRVRALILSGIMAAFASFFLAAQVQVGDPRAGSGFALTSIAAAVLGGTSIAGGRGSFVGAVTASLFLSLIVNVLPLLGLSSSFGLISIGVLTVIALVLYQVQDLRVLAIHTGRQVYRLATARRVKKERIFPSVYMSEVAPVVNERTLLKGGTVLTLDPKIGNFTQADVLIDGDKIVEVRPDLSTGDDVNIIDASNMIVMPGFIDTHRHIWEGILRNIGTDVPLEGRESYLSFILGRLAPAYRPEDAYVGNLVSALGAINAGITTLLDWSHIQASPDHTDAVIAALQASGMRTVFAYGFPWWGKWEPKQPGWFVRAATKYFNSKDQLLTLALAAPGPEFTEFEVARAHWKLARDVGARISVHVGVGTFGQEGKLQRMGAAGLLRSDTTYIHCTTLNDTEIQMIVDTGGTVSLAAPVEMMMGHGMVPTQKFLDRGLRPSLSVDVETNVPSDMFIQMRTVLSLQRALLFNRALAGESNLPPLLTARDALEFATIEGARANGLDHKVGTLTPGKEADIIMLRTDRVNVMPVNDPIGAVVWGMDTSNVDSVFVAGKALKRHGQLVNVDLNCVEKLVTESRDYVVAKSGFKLPSI